MDEFHKSQYQTKSVFNARLHCQSVSFLTFLTSILQIILMQSAVELILPKKILQSSVRLNTKSTTRQSLSNSLIDDVKVHWDHSRAPLKLNLFSFLGTHYGSSESQSNSSFIRHAYTNLKTHVRKLETRTPNTLIRFCIKTDTFLMHFRLSQPKTLMKTEAFENASFLAWIGENGGFGKRCREKRHILSFPSAFSRSFRRKTYRKVCVFEWKRFSVDRWKQNENATVVENTLLRVRRDENRFF